MRLLEHARGRCKIFAARFMREVGGRSVEWWVGVSTECTHSHTSD